MELRQTPKIIPYGAHGVSRKQIHTHAMDVIKGLKKAGFDAYLVGGGIRDLLLKKHPKDFDVATNAEPKEIKNLFRRCHLIGRRFRLAHVYFGRAIIEVATFRASHDNAHPHHAHMRNGVIVRDNVYGSIEQDVIRRDFTVNALYYDIETQDLLDFCDGFHDIKHRCIRMIGDPTTRYQEDPVRMLRAIRFAAKTDFKLTKETASPIIKLKALLQHVPAARLYDETIKLFHSGFAKNIFPLLLKYHLFEELFPLSHQHLKQSKKMIAQLFKNTDQRIQQEKPVVAHFLFAALLWTPLTKEFQKQQTKNKYKIQALDEAIQITLQQQRQYTTIPRRISGTIRDIWILQHRLEQRRSRYIMHLLTHPRFRAAYDLLLLRQCIHEIPKSLTRWWTALQDVNHATRKKMIHALEHKRFSSSL